MRQLWLGGNTTDSGSRVVATHRQAILLIATVAVAVLVADSVTLLVHSGRGTDHGSAARGSPHRRPVTSGPPTRQAASPRATTTHAATPQEVARRDPFRDEARAYIATRSGTVLGAVYDERTGQTWTLGRSSPQDEASIVKVDILETLLAQHHASGTPLSAGDVTLAQQMIENSDNDAATALWEEIGVHAPSALTTVRSA